MSTVTNERIAMRVDPEIKLLAERASAAAGTTLTEFIVSLIRSNAPKILKEQTSIKLTNQEFDNFINFCELEKEVPKKLKMYAQRLDDEGY